RKDEPEGAVSVAERDARRGHDLAGGEIEQGTDLDEIGIAVPVHVRDGPSVDSPDVIRPRHEGAVAPTEQDEESGRRGGRADRRERRQVEDMVAVEISDMDAVGGLSQVNVGSRLERAVTAVEPDPEQPVPVIGRNEVDVAVAVEVTEVQRRTVA